MSYSNTPRGSQSGRSQVRNISAVFMDVMDQIEGDAFPPELETMAEEAARIITEVYLMPSGWEIKIDGQSMPAGMVQGMFAFLRHEHVADVLYRFSEIPYEIRHVKSYLRTALYNAVFESEARTANSYRKDHAE